MTGPWGTPLDLRAVEALIREFDTAGDDDFDTAQRVYDHMKALLAHCRALVEALKAIAAPDDLLEANEGAFNIHAARRMQAIATEALKGITDAA